MPESKATYSYEAFISYRQIEPDKTVAARLHRALETYRVPRSLVKEGIPRRLKRIFRDKDELAASSNLGESIEEALKQSRFLIVICSRRTPESKWVTKEIETFCELGREDNILCLLIEGEQPTESLPIPLRPAHPTIVCDKVAKPKIEETIEPLAADIRAPKLSHSLKLLKVEKLRLIATILGRSFDDLRQREHRRFVKRLILINLLMVVLVVSFAVLAAYAFMQQKEAERRRFISVAQALAAYAPREQEQGNNDERAALFARQAYLFNRLHRGNRLDQIDKALREVLSKAYFSVKLAGGGAELTSLAFSRNGQMLAAGGDDSNIRLWNLQKPGSPPMILKPRLGIIRSLVFNPKKDTLAVGTEDGNLLLWELNEIEETYAGKILTDHERKGITTLAISSDGERLASACVDGKVRIWNFHEPEQNPIILHCDEQNSIPWSVVFNPLSSNIVAIGSGEVVRIWNIHKPRELLVTLKEHDNVVTSLAFSPDGSTIASGTDRSLRILSIGERLERGPQSSEIEVVGGTISLWNLLQEELKPLVLKDHKTGISSLAFNKNGEILASVGKGEKNVRLWYINQLDTPPKVLKGHTSGISTVAFSPNGKMLASVGKSESLIRIWDMGRPCGAPIILDGHYGAIRSLAFSPDSHILASAGGEDGTVRLWKLDEAREVGILDHKDGWAVAVAYSPDGKIIASSNETRGIGMEPDNTVRLWNPLKPSKPWSVLSGHTSSIESLTFSKNGKLLASAGILDNDIKLWELDSIETQTLSTVLKTGHGKITSVKFAQNDKILAWAINHNGDYTIQICDLTQPRKKPIVLKGHTDFINSISFGPAGRKLASGSDDSTVLIWDLRKPTKAPIVFTHEAEVHCVAIDHNGTTLASGSADGKVRLWDVTNIDVDARIFTGLGSDVYAVAFSPNGRWLAAGGKNNKVIVWPRTKVLVDMVCEKVWRNLTEDEWSEFVGTERYESTCMNLPPGKKTKGN